MNDRGQIPRLTRVVNTYQGREVLEYQITSGMY